MQCCLYVYRIIYLVWSHGIRFSFHTTFFPWSSLYRFLKHHTLAHTRTHALARTKHIPKQIEFFVWLERLWFFGFSHQTHTHFQAIQHSIWKHPKRMLTNCGPFISFTLFHEMWFQWIWPLFLVVAFHLNSPVSRNQDKCSSRWPASSHSLPSWHSFSVRCSHSPGSRITLNGFLSVLVIVFNFTIRDSFFFASD